MFSRFLNWLDDGVDSSGQRYLEMRRRLELYFLRRNCPHPEELADETLNRVARRLDEEGTITAASPAHFCYAVAKFVLHESVRRRNSANHAPVEDIAEIRASSSLNVDTTASEALLDALESCLETLSAPERELILDYYRGELRVKIEQRRALAARLGLTMNALSVRACRVREKLETCVKSRMKFV